MFGGLGGIGALGQGFMNGLDMAAQLRDRQTELQIKALKLQNDMIDAKVQGAAFNAFWKNGMMPTDMDQGIGKSQPQQTPQVPMDQGVSGLAPMQGQQAPGFAPQTPGVAMAPGQPSMPAGQQQGPQIPAQQPQPGVQPNPYAAPQIPDPNQELQRLAQHIKAANPGLNDRELYHVMLQSIEAQGAISRILSPDARILAQLQLEAIRQQGRSDIVGQQQAGATERTQLQQQGAGERVGAQQAGATERTQLQQQGAGERAQAGIASREKIAGENIESREKIAGETIADRKAGRDAAMSRAQFVQQQLNARFAQGSGDKTRLQAQLVRSREIIAQMNAAQRIMNGIELATPGVKPETNAQYAAAQRSYEDAQAKLEILEKQSATDATATKPTAGGVVDYNDLK